MRRLAKHIGMAVMTCALSACAASDTGISAIQPAALVAAPANPAPMNRSGRDARAPSGYLGFCSRNPQECGADSSQPDRIKLTGDVLAMLEKVNIAVNEAVEPEDDKVHYGVNEFWTVPTDGAGDCEDYVLAKRKMLVLLGLPPSALRITVVVNNRFERHAVLTVVTTQADYVLDNARDDILPTQKVDYHWVERQDPASATGWRSLEPR